MGARVGMNFMRLCAGLGQGFEVGSVANQEFVWFSGFDKEVFFQDIWQGKARLFLIHLPFSPAFVGVKYV